MENLNRLIVFTAGSDTGTGREAQASNTLIPGDGISYPSYPLTNMT